ncbi:MAG: cytochrome-c oxidase, cbb3-type subunit III [Euryhalocaulis sp.]|uniref:cytochrome-c oxidase, cbb3-type subunit III n=1 Tax=Euryhalocaulis sp. TaxID=2744307 RepID=UPI001834B6FF|nr:cytochrome-c oxidase, cbb3-type subunit III [Euryhalocaulis sp.]MBA4800828.1 cytochrome-c oxidase, cbb3-type subunit III [Euryhalocaulis sp.]
MADKPEIDEVSGVETTGHEWDGIKELNNPLPRWWLWIFYASVVWSVIYMVFMPALPAPPGFDGFTKGLTGNSERENVAEAMAALEASRSENFERLTGATLEEIESDPDLFRFALAAGESAFGDNCATCHGSGAQGFKGYPNLNDDVWLWGGSYEEILHTLHVGIRSEHPQTRFSMMPAFGADGIYGGEEIGQVTQHVLSLSGQEHDPERAALGAEIFSQQCASCHGPSGAGDRTFGAPNLTDAEWLYGGSSEEIYQSIWRGPAGVMPAWSERLDEAVIAALATYVHSLGGGEDAETETGADEQDPAG